MSFFSKDNGCTTGRSETRVSLAAAKFYSSTISSRKHPSIQWGTSHLLREASLVPSIPLLDAQISSFNLEMTRRMLSMKLKTNSGSFHA